MSLQCVECGSEFDRRSATGRIPRRCDPCASLHRRQQFNALQRRRYAESPEVREKHRQKYLNSIKDPQVKARRNAISRSSNFSKRLEKSPYPPGDKCEICFVAFEGGRQGPCWDHNHQTGVFRGWLCGSCNAGLGRFKDNPALLMQAAQYLVMRGHKREE